MLDNLDALHAHSLLLYGRVLLYTYCIFEAVVQLLYTCM